MKRLLVFLALLLLAPSLVFGLGAGLKKTLVLVPNETAATGYQQFIIGTLVIQGGGEYESLNYSTSQGADSLDALLDRAALSGKYGLVIVCAQQVAYTNDDAAYPEYGNGVVCKYVSIEQSPIGIPTVMLGRSAVRGTHGANAIYTGASAGTNWSYDSTPGNGTADDSLWCKTSTGDTLIYYLGDRKHLLDIDGHPEHDYPWTVDIFVNDRAATRRNGSATCLWHVHRTAYDAAQLPGAGQDSVIYYLPNWNTTFGSTKAAPIKALAMLLKKFGCINYYPVSVDIYDYGYASVTPTEAALFAGADSFQAWCATNKIPVTYYTDYCGSSATVKTEMDGMLALGYCKFAWHPTTQYYAPTGLTGAISPNDSTQGTIFTSWPFKTARDSGPVLAKNLKYNWAKLSSAGMLTGNHFDIMGFASGNMSGKSGVIKTDSILTALASAGARQFVTEVSATGALWHSGNSGYRGINYPYDKYPIDLTWTGDTVEVNVSFKTLSYIMTGLSAAADSNYANPAILTPYSIVTGGYGQSQNFHDGLARWMLGSARPKDKAATLWTDAAADWGYIINGAVRGFSLTGDWTHFRVHKTSWHNMIWNWTRWYYDNLDAYNNLAGADVFRFMYLSESPQRINEDM
jgi:hypothetical protein